MPRPIWKGSLSFGLVSIPIEMHMAVHEKAVHFHMVTKDGHCRLRRKLVCPDTGKEYDFNQTAKGIEVGPNDYAVVDQREIDRLKPEKGQSLDIVQFFDLKSIDPLYFDRVYYLLPAKEGRKAYKLLVSAMTESGKSAIGQFVMRERQYTATIRTSSEHLVLHTLHYADEVDPMDEDTTSAVEKLKVSAGEMKMAGELIKAMTRPLNLQEFKDDFREQLQALVEAKTNGKEIKPAPEPKLPAGRTINLMDALKRSLAAGAAKKPQAVARGRTARHRRPV
jgi:DNA end-binding protein Ku